MITYVLLSHDHLNFEGIRYKNIPNDVLNSTQGTLDLSDNQSKKKKTVEKAMGNHSAIYYKKSY